MAEKFPNSLIAREGLSIQLMPALNDQEDNSEVNTAKEVKISA